MKSPDIHKNNLKKLVIVLLLIACLITIAISLIKIITWQQDNHKSRQLIRGILDVKQSSNIDFDKLNQQNPDTVAWLKIPKTDIDYPVVKTDNNRFYLNHDFNKQPNQTGWIFADYRNSFESLNQNTIIYGHASFSGLMFGTLKNILKNQQDGNNQPIVLSTKQNETKWQIFSAYTIKTTEDYLKTSFSSDQELEDYITLVTSRSLYDYNAKPAVGDKLLTLSTCHSETERTVVQAKLLKN